MNEDKLCVLCDKEYELLDLLFWQALGKAMEWDLIHAEWKTKWYHLIEHLRVGQQCSTSRRWYML